MRNKVIIKGIVFVLFIFGIFSCSKKEEINDKIEINNSENTILIASFNTLRLGEKEKDYRTLSKILAKFDLIGLEEVMNEKGVKRVQRFLEKLTKEKWDYIISENSVEVKIIENILRLYIERISFQKQGNLDFIRKKMKMSL